MVCEERFSRTRWPQNKFVAVRDNPTFHWQIRYIQMDRLSGQAVSHFNAERRGRIMVVGFFREEAQCRLNKSVLSPVVTGTHAILEDQVLDLNKLQQQKDQLEYEAMVRNPETAYMVSDEEFDKKLDELGWSPSDIGTMAGMYMDRQAYKIEKAIKDWFRNLLEILFQAAALVIDTIRTFFLIVLSILGPIAFAISVWDGFQSTLTQWLTRYVSVYLWLPVSDLFSSMLARIQSLILERDIAMLADPTFIPDTSNTVYIIFMIIGIIGYFTIPTVTGWVIQAGGAGNFTRNVNQAAMKTGNIAGAGAGSTVGNIGGKLMNK